MDQIGKWLGPLGQLVSAATDRDLSAADQRNQVSYAHTELYKELRHMDAVQADLLEALEMAEAKLCMAEHMLDLREDDSPSFESEILIARAAIARARGEA